MPENQKISLADDIIWPSHAIQSGIVNAKGEWVLEITKRSGWTIPNIEGLQRKAGSHNAKYYASLDYISGYHQAPLAERSRKYTGFVTTEGVFEWCRVPMRPLAAPGYFQRQIQMVVAMVRTR